MSNKMFDKIFKGEDNVNHPSHYTEHPSGVETIEITRELPFDLGNAWKYLMRFRYKHRPAEDLQKAIWYLKDYIANLAYKRGELAKSIKEQIEYNGDCFSIDLTNNDITAKMLKVIASEKNQYVRAAMELIATFATYSSSQFIDVYQVMHNLEANIQDIASDEKFAEVLDTTESILENMSDAESETSAEANNDIAAEHTERELITEREFPDAVDNSSLIDVIVNASTNEVVSHTVELNPIHTYRTELVAVPCSVMAMGEQAARNYAESLVNARLHSELSEACTTDSAKRISKKKSKATDVCKAKK